MGSGERKLSGLSTEDKVDGGGSLPGIPQRSSPGISLVGCSGEPTPSCESVCDSRGARRTLKTSHSSSLRRKGPNVAQEAERVGWWSEGCEFECRGVHERDN